MEDVFNMYINTGRDSPNPRLIALDKNSGEVVFDVSTAIDGRAGLGHSAAPLAVKDKILIGSTGRNESGRGYVTAFAADTGKFLWRFSVVPEPGQPGSETWADPRTIPFGAEQRDAVQALPATPHLGIELPDQLRPFVPDVEFPVLLVLVPHIHEAVLDQRREILVALSFIPSFFEIKESARREFLSKRIGGAFFEA
jgi:hypothetical protein